MYVTADVAAQLAGRDPEAQERTELWLQLFFNGRSHLFRIWRNRWLETLNDVAVAVHQKLGEVPLDIATDGRPCFFSEVGVKRRLVGFFNRNLRIYGKCDAVLAGA